MVGVLMDNDHGDADDAFDGDEAQLFIFQLGKVAFHQSSYSSIDLKCVFIYYCIFNIFFVFK